MSSRRVAERAFALVVAALAVLNVTKAFPDALQAYGWPYWRLTWAHGFVRRGLIGSLFQLAFSGARVETQRSAVMALHVALAIALDLALAAWCFALWRRARAADRPLVAAAGAALFLSPLPTTLLYLAGNLDVFVVAFAAAAAYAWSRSRVRLAAALAAVGVLVHESFVFLWLPIVLVAASAGVERRRLGWLAAPFVVVASAVVLHRSEAAAEMLAAPDARFLRGTYGWPLGDQLRTSTADLAEHLGDTAIAAALLLPAAVVIAACAIVVERRRALVFVAATLAPATALLVAWDVTRFLVWTVFGAFVALAFARPGDATEAPSRARSAAAAAATVLLAAASTGPLVYAFHPYAFAVYTRGPEAFLSTPAAEIAVRYVLAKNERRDLRSYRLAQRCDATLIDADRAPGCVVTLAAGGSLETAEAFVGAGRHSVHLATTFGDTCLETPYALVAVETPWRFAFPRAPVKLPAGSAIVEFDVSRRDAAFGLLRVKVSAPAGCVRVDDLRITRDPMD
jgi:hypothetical protein